MSENTNKPSVALNLKGVPEGLKPMFETAFAELAKNPAYANTITAVNNAVKAASKAAKSDNVLERFEWPYRGASDFVGESGSQSSVVGLFREWRTKSNIPHVYEAGTNILDTMHADKLRLSKQAVETVKKISGKGRMDGGFGIR